jgi:cysteine-rich repeat protein
MCGDGIIDPGEQCDDGPQNQVAAAFWVTQSGRSFAATPLVRDMSDVDFYSYSSASAHTGFEALETSRIMLYLDRSTRSLGLIVFHGIDENSSGESQPKSLVVMQFSGLPETTTVDVIDDDSQNEFTMTSSTEGTGYWNFTGNSDGVALGNLPIPDDWTITVSPAFRSGVSTWTWIQSDGSLVDLDLTLPLTIQARSSHRQCRSDCTIPWCGDGILDGGEICDDGQPSALGCSADCLWFN